MGLKTMGADKKDNKLNPMYNQLVSTLNPKTGEPVKDINSRDMIRIYREMKNWEGIQSGSAALLHTQAETRQANASAFRDSVEGDKDVLQLNDDKDQKLAGDLYSSHFDPSNNSLTNIGDLALVGSDGKPLPLNEAQKKDRQHKSNLLLRALSLQYQKEHTDFVDKYHPKVVDGRETTDDAQGQAAQLQLGGLARSISTLQKGGAPPDSIKTNLPPSSVSEIHDRNREGLTPVTQQAYDSLNLTKAPDLASARIAAAKLPDVAGFDREALNKKLVDFFTQKDKLKNNQESQTETRIISAHEQNIWGRVNTEHPNDSQEEKQKWYNYYRGSLFVAAPKPLKQ
jgi:hypothetical protein